jgi:hypothetical protein
MNALNRIAIYSAITALIGLSGCIVDPGRGHNGGEDRHGDTSQHHDEHHDDGRCNDPHDEHCHDRDSRR